MVEEDRRGRDTRDVRRDILTSEVGDTGGFSHLVIGRGRLDLTKG